MTTPFVSMPAPQPAADPLARELGGILKFINDDRLQDAAHALNALQRRAPGDARVPLLGMRMAQRAGNAKGAVEMAQRAVRLAPEWHVAQIELAQALTHTRSFKEAMEHARRAVELAPHELRVLLLAISVAEGEAESEDVFAWIDAALSLASPDSSLRARLLLVRGNEHFKRARYAEARAAFEELLAANADDEMAQRAMAMLEMGEGNNEAAIPILEKLRARHPEDRELEIVWEQAHGRMPATRSAGDIRVLFDDYAEQFDLHLVRVLHYDTPKRVADIIRELHPDKKFNLLDLACGTGLLGVYLGPIQGYMIGVDLSEKMIAQAARHRLYARFHHVNVLDALRETPDDIYEVITCLDALVYIGDLHPVVPNACRILKAGGHFITTYERMQEDEEGDMVLRTSGRYAHKESFVVKLHKDSGFEDVRAIDLPQLRSEAGQPLPGFIVVARKGGDAAPAAA